MSFEVTPEQSSKINEWLMKEIYPQVIEKQKQDLFYLNHPFAKKSWEDGCPETGAIGGGVTFEFTPTGLGVIFVVRETLTSEKNTLNLTDYDKW